MGMQFSTIIMESNIDIPQKAKDKSVTWSSSTDPGHICSLGYTRDT
jgi:hypothetical protein